MDASGAGERRTEQTNGKFLYNNEGGKKSAQSRTDTVGKQKSITVRRRAPGPSSKPSGSAKDPRRVLRNQQGICMVTSVAEVTEFDPPKPPPKLRACGRTDSATRLCDGLLTGILRELHVVVEHLAFVLEAVAGAVARLGQIKQELADVKDAIRGRGLHAEQLLARRDLHVQHKKGLLRLRGFHRGRGRRERASRGRGSASSGTCRRRGRDHSSVRGRG